jgi:hypothetical protein
MKGYICPCCGIRKEVDDLEDENAQFCQPCGSSASKLPDMTAHVIPVTNPVCVLDVREAFTGLTDQEKMYAYWVGRASWEGSLICLRQCSPESIPIFCLMMTIFSSRPMEEILQSAKASGMSDEDISQILVYVAGNTSLFLWFKYKLLIHLNM